MGKLLGIVSLLLILPGSFLFSCPAECLLNVAECNLLKLRSAISPEKLEDHLQHIERKTRRAERRYLRKLMLDDANEKIEQVKLQTIEDKTTIKARKDLVYVIAIAMERLPELFLLDDLKMPLRIEIIVKLYPAALYLDALKTATTNFLSKVSKPLTDPQLL